MDNFINISRLKFKATASGELDFLDFFFYAESKDRFLILLMEEIRLTTLHL